LPKHRNLLEDRRGASATAAAALVSIAVILMIIHELEECGYLVGYGDEQ